MIEIENGKEYRGMKNEIHKRKERKLKSNKKEVRKTDRKEGKKGREIEKEKN